MNRSMQPYRDRRSSQALTKAAERAVQREREKVAVTATSIEGTAYITYLSVTHVGNLSALESQVVSSTPASDPIQKEQVARRTGMLVDNFAITAASEIAKRGV